MALNRKNILQTLANPTWYIVFSFIWSSITHCLTLPWVLGGILLSFVPIFGAFVILLNYIMGYRKLIFPYAWLVIIYFVYISIIHIIHGDFTVHGLGDMYCGFFFLTCLLDDGENDYVHRFLVVCRTMLWISIIFAMTSFFVDALAPLLSKPDLPIWIHATISKWLTPAGSSRLTGIGGNSNYTALWCVYGLFFGFGAISLDPQNKFYFVSFLIDILLTCSILLLTACRTAILALAIFCIAILIWYFIILKQHLSYKTTKIINIILLCTVTAVLILVIAFFTIESVKKFWLSVFRIEYIENMPFGELLSKTLKSFSYASDRDRLRENALELWQNHKLFGVSTEDVIASFGNTTLSSKNGSHNAFIQVLATTGILGFILHISLWLIACMGFIVYMIRCRNKYNQLMVINHFSLIMFVILIFNNFFENYMYTNITLMSLAGFLVFATGMYSLKMATRKEIEKS